MNSMELYRYLLYKISYEQISDDKKIEKASKTYEIAKGLFTLRGNEDFKQIINHQIELMCSIKPGRKLIKWLLENRQKNNIIIEPGKECEVLYPNHFRSSHIVTIDPTHTKYKAITPLGYRNAQSPLYVTIAHELIHILHDIIYDKNVNHWGAPYLREMDKMKEQQAIIGYNPSCFINTAKKIDVLCENAFLMALNLPPRIDHRVVSDELKDLDDSSWFNEINQYDFCYDLLSKKLGFNASSFNDEEEALKIINELPELIKNVSSELLANDQFLLSAEKLISTRIFELLPQIKENKLLILELGKKNEAYYFRAAKSLWNDQEFVLTILNEISYTYLEKWIISLPSELSTDRDFLNKALELISKKNLHRIDLPLSQVNDPKFFWIQMKRKLQENL